MQIEGAYRVISNCLVPNYEGRLIDIARRASGSIDGPGNHSKLGSAGIHIVFVHTASELLKVLISSPKFPICTNLLDYQYQKRGFLVSSIYKKNTSSNIPLTYNATTGNVMVQYVCRYLLNSIMKEFYPLMTWKRGSLDQAGILA